MKNLCLTISAVVFFMTAICSLLVRTQGENAQSSTSSATSRHDTVAQPDGTISGADAASFTAYNLLNGTSAKIHATDRQTVLYRNQSNAASVFQQASKRQLNFKFQDAESGMGHRLWVKYRYNRQKADILYGGLSSNSDRIHLLRVLII